METLSDLIQEDHKDVALELVEIVNADIFEEEKAERIKAIYNDLSFDEQIALWDRLRLLGIEFGSHHKKITTVIKEYLI